MRAVEVQRWHVHSKHPESDRLQFYHSHDVQVTFEERKSYSEKCQEIFLKKIQWIRDGRQFQPAMLDNICSSTDVSFPCRIEDYRFQEELPPSQVGFSLKD